ncbi:hypothetical protein Bphy_4813 [Paraburkholderia phymatum STM815]|uniref:Uncharacterized protein n=1 Tax=Paraburkholderia phymatum (strain DSM 17167 / CIP 108236 / LMG 21445 / STM815) TaxID=391038 RepID=B2JS02_PARP8|nr:hypothetical protein Bphy_4813 [Paraburkholderia phymatum STM815]
MSLPLFSYRGLRRPHDRSRVEAALQPRFRITPPVDQPGSGWPVRTTLESADGFGGQTFCRLLQRERNIGTSNQSVSHVAHY